MNVVMNTFLDINKASRETIKKCRKIKTREKLPLIYSKNNAVKSNYDLRRQYHSHFDDYFDGECGREDNLG